jgi:hypothetical protein
MTHITQGADPPSTVFYRFYNTHSLNWNTCATDHEIMKERVFLYYQYQEILGKNLTYK